MREIVLDTETTGLSPSLGHRLIEIGCIELDHHFPTGKTFQCYINPERDVPQEAFQVHGLSQEFLSQFPSFSAHHEKFLAFIGKSPLVIHNAKFDMTFLNAELARLSIPALTNPVIDTLKMARQKFPGSPASLDALCRQFQIDLSQRSFHGALLDAHLLSQVYLELKGGRQTVLEFQISCDRAIARDRPYRKPRSFEISSQEKELYAEMMRELKKISDLKLT